MPGTWVADLQEHDANANECATPDALLLSFKGDAKGLDNLLHASAVSDPNAMFDGQRSCAYIAAHEGHVDALACLFRHGADINVPNVNG